VVLRGQPGSGRSGLMDAVATQLGGVISVTRVSGSADEATLRGAAEKFEAETSGQNVGAALIDDFGSALSAPHGVVFQNRLHAWCVDGEHAPEAGVLLIARLNESLTRFPASGGGSPLAGAAHAEFAMPTLGGDEVVASLVDDGCEGPVAVRLVDMFGAHLRLIAMARETDRCNVPDATKDEAVMQAVSETTGTTAARMLELARRPNRPLATSLADQLLAPVVYHPVSGFTKLSAVLADRGIGALMVGGRTGWPGEINASVRRFWCRLHGLRDAIWVDRYHGSHLDHLTDFFDRLAARGARLLLRMLGSTAGIQELPDRPRRRFEGSLAAWTASGLRIEWRIAAQQDYDLLHQRMLVSPFHLGGYLVPPCDRITGAFSGGTDTDAILDPAPLPLLANAWARASLFVRG
jgi:hypothetical protein